MKILRFYLLVLTPCMMSSVCAQGALSWESSPLNFQNSPLNFDNSPLNYKNSPLNFNSTNGVYDNSGNRIGYGVTTPTGVTNFFDNHGNRSGYKPSSR